MFPTNSATIEKMPATAYVQMIEEGFRNAATYLDNGEYYITLFFEKLTDKQRIMKLYEEDRNFGKEEEEALERIIDKNSIEAKSNVFDYYA